MVSTSNSITKHIDEHSIASRVRQLRSEFQRTHKHPVTMVIVEGKILDSLFYSSLFDRNYCHVEPSHGKQNAIKAINILVGERFEGIFAIIDDDFDTLTDSKIEHEHIIVTDTHDIENLIISSPALDKLLLFLLPNDKYKFHTSFVQVVRQKALSICLPVAYLKWSLHKDNISVDYSQVNIRNYIDQKKLLIDINRMVKEVLSKNGDCTKSETELITTVTELLKENKYEWHLICQGHDLAKILCILLPELLITYYAPANNKQSRFPGQITSIISDEKSLMRQLALCYEMKYFEQTSMYSSIIEWEKRNQPYVVLT